jgi:hypothetical protein
MPDSASRHWDVAVAGGGTAGIAAAISAARTGASTLLVETSGLLGGNAALALVHTFCGLYLPPRDGTLGFANPGFASRLATWLQQNGGALPAEIHGPYGVLPILPERLPELLLKAAAAQPNLTLLLETQLAAVRDTAPFQLEFQNRGGIRSATASLLIDTTGDAQAAALLGADFLLSPPGELQHPTFIFRVSGANSGDLQGYKRLQLSAAVARSCKSGKLAGGCDSVLVRAAEQPGHALVSLNLPKPGTYDPLDPLCLSELETQAHAQAEALIVFFRETLPGWEQCALAAWPQRVGIRETRRVRGSYVMTEEDILSGARFEDGVAVSTWPIELWNKHTGADFQHPAGPAQIPLRALASATHPRLGMAGRCVSATHAALGALRVMGTGLATGEAAGIAAALAARQGCALDGVRAQDVMELKHQIHETAGDTP